MKSWTDGLQREVVSLLHWMLTMDAFGPYLVFPLNANSTRLKIAAYSARPAKSTARRANDSMPLQSPDSSKGRGASQDPPTARISGAER